MATIFGSNWTKPRSGSSEEAIASLQSHCCISRGVNSTAPCCQCSLLTPQLGWKTPTTEMKKGSPLSKKRFILVNHDQGPRWLAPWSTRERHAQHPRPRFEFVFFQIWRACSLASLQRCLNNRLRPPGGIAAPAGSLRGLWFLLPQRTVQTMVLPAISTGRKQILKSKQ